jgi:hypothetical protein
MDIDRVRYSFSQKSRAAACGTNRETFTFLHYRLRHGMNGKASFAGTSA